MLGEIVNSSKKIKPKCHASLCAPSTESRYVLCAVNGSIVNGVEPTGLLGSAQSNTNFEPESHEASQQCRARDYDSLENGYKHSNGMMITLFLYVTVMKIYVLYMSLY